MDWGGGPSTNAIGVLATDKKNITIRNANIRGFYYGISLNGGSGHVVEDSSFDGNIRSSIDAGHDSSYVSGLLVRKNTIQNMVVEGQLPLGISVGGNGIRIENNTITKLSDPVSSAFGIVVFDEGGVWILGNFIEEISSGGSYNDGILVYGGDNTEIRDNLISSGSNLSHGVWIISGSSVCRDNTILNASDAFAGCTLIGDNYGVDTPPAAQAEAALDAWSAPSIP